MKSPQKFVKIFYFLQSHLKFAIEMKFFSVFVLALATITAVAVADEVVHIFDGYEIHHHTVSAPAQESVYDFVGDARVINGSDAQEGQFPFVARVSIVRTNADGSTSGGSCTGSLITQHFGLSASHCVRKFI